MARRKIVVALGKCDTVWRSYCGSAARSVGKNSGTTCENNGK